MGIVKTEIPFCDYVWNVTSGCKKYSEGCENCYAESFHKRLMKMNSAKYFKPFNEFIHHWHELEGTKFPKQKGKIVFVNSMSDIFYDKMRIDFERDLLNMMKLNSDTIFLLISKRIENAAFLFPEYIFPENVWIGATCENQKRLDERLPYLLQIKAKTRFLLLEPLLTNVWFFDKPGIRDISWVIAGCETGNNRRSIEEMAFYNIKNQCDSLEIPLFIKQIENSRGEVVKDINHFPETLRKREYPNEKK